MASAKKAQFEQENSELRHEIDKLREQNESLLQHRNQLIMDLDRFTGAKKQLRSLLSTVYDGLYRRADSIAYTQARSAPEHEIEDAKDPVKLLKFIESYDRKVLTERVLVGPAWRRTLSKTTKGALIIPRKSARKSLMLARKVRRQKAVS